MTSLSQLPFQERITVPSQALLPAIRFAIDHKTKPLGALGQLEAVAEQLCLIQQTLTPVIRRPQMAVFAGDHGVADEGVSAFPQAVTQQMVLNFLGGGAAINCFCRTLGWQLAVIDAGIAAPLPAHPQLLDRAVVRGTANFVHQPALTAAQCQQALLEGESLVADWAVSGSNLLACGEMGIANTTAAAALLAALTGWSADECVGRGTGIDDRQLVTKQRVVTAALSRLQPGLTPLQLLAEVGGAEIAMMTGAMLAAAARQMVIIVDGFIASVSALAAVAIAPACRHYLLFGHCSAEGAHRRLLNHFQGQPLLQLGLRLGEGTGAALALPLVQSAAAFMTEMASFAEAGVSDGDVATISTADPCSV